MTATTPSLVREQLTPGPIPLHDLSDWHSYGAIAGITGRGADAGRGFDLGLWSDAPVGEVMSRWRAFRRALPGFDAVILGNQVHGIVVETIGPSRGWIQIEGVDGWVTTARGVLLTVTVAD
jgi:copper oxidase (laccase) domain-containing protein